MVRPMPPILLMVPVLANLGRSGADHHRFPAKRVRNATASGFVEGLSVKLPGGSTNGLAGDRIRR